MCNSPFIPLLSEERISLIVSDIDQKIRQADTDWKAALSPALSSSSLEVCALIAERMSTYERVRAISENAQRQASQGLFLGGGSLGGGLGGLALLYLYQGRCLDEPRWEELAHTYLRMAAQATQQAPLSMPNAFLGSSGFTHIVAEFCKLEPRYQKTRDMLLANVAQQVLE